MYEKPPLKLWLGSLAPLLLGESNFSVRLLDGLLGVATVLLTVSIMEMLTGSVWLALVAGLLLLGMPELVISHHGFRRAVLDGLLTVLTLLVVQGTWRLLALESGVASRRSITRAALWVGILCSLGVLTKSVAGFVPALCAALAWLVASEDTAGSWFTRVVRNRVWLCIVVPPVATFLGYCVALWLVVGPKALDVFIGVEILTRTFAGFEGHNTGQRWFYLSSLFVRGSAVPRALLIVGLVGALGAALTATKKRHELRFLLVWACVPVILYSLAASKVPWYLNPFLPCIGMLSVAGAWQLIIFLKQRYGKIIARSFFALVVIATLPAYARAIMRHAESVHASTERIELDTFVSRLRREYTSFVVLEKSLSGRSNPLNGRFNVEGIYREMLRPGLRIVSTIEELNPQPGEVVLVREESLAKIPSGWRELGRIPPYASRTWGVVAVVYEGDKRE
jgi:4-amino-4-deoxy-L-arabinose transferase-like glycosyltransferase